MKKLMSVILACVITLSMSATAFAAEPLEQKQTGFVEFTLDEIAPYASDYYSRSLPVFNIVTGGVSNQFIVSAPSLPANTTVTSVVVKGSLSGGPATWCVSNSDGFAASKKFVSTATFSEFKGSTANTSWTVWIEGADWTTVRGTSFRVNYTY
ncbi:MAG: hypothetical protein RSA86_07200 [Christensenellaceae bacterium]